VISRDLIHDPLFTLGFFVVYLAVATTEGQSTFHALVFAPAPADGTEQTRGFLRRRNDGGKVAWRGWGQVPDALRAGNQCNSHRGLNNVRTDSSINVARLFLYRRAVLMFIVDFLFG
jgi:hypothetical protein